jgi:hypothetical protein
MRASTLDALLALWPLAASYAAAFTATDRSDRMAFLSALVCAMVSSF